MKIGRTLSEVAAEITRQTAAKKDFIAPTSEIAVAVERPLTAAPRLVLGVGLGDQQSVFPLRDLALQQIGERSGVPAKYLTRMRDEAPELAATNLNHWLHRGEPQRRLIRTLDGNVRAYLSDKYQRSDNFQIASTVLPVLKDRKGLEIVSTEITESHLYIKAVDTNIQLPVHSRRVGDLVEAGVIVTNSEVGLGAVTVSPFSRFLACLNGMTREGGKRWNHIGKRAAELDGLVYADDTLQADDNAQLLMIRDTLNAAMDPAKFQLYIDKLNGTVHNRIEGKLDLAIKVLGNELDLTAGEQDSVLRHLAEGGDLSQYGLINAVTRTAEDASSYDRATELEALGGRVLDLNASEWRRIAHAA